ncbi:ArsC family reductase [Sphingomonas pseudosanguinis]|uniref:Spx/MgsR family transcriptional regulator n=1 Tax=Sphingomonas pseudosanguinis TaxID=413712 RepID=A0A7W6F247_9SPHN|nr:ArsC family reductase [Sphingomonas pseudosanguinis]MBB3878594.1 Spx/MgsR family transcriptional regulator [Sphingomonas pseudosanguinis]MBN3536153.1 ArsC family reductase [Sphingomonas pseudosanguinis]
MSITLYGIPNCDTMKKARVWLDQHGVAYRFHNYKTDGIDEATLRRWVDQVGWEPLLNRAGTTFRKLDDADRQDVDADKAIRLMAAHPSLIKRPVLDRDGTLTVGFKLERYAEIF